MDKEWSIGEIEMYIEVTEEGRMQLGLNPGLNKLEELFPIDNRKQHILPKHEWKRYERSVLRKREEWIRENIPAGRYSVVVQLDSNTLEKE